ncbi:HAD family hydrolase [Marinactinospora thermotolerans]|uniref:Putative hydrolase of the HAD superfamily n=1 Tax=Marinactinospora thermotolerans DSM 45154 TaxID=1122192 RepID=A0A1T4RMB6_9ACTN|nr:HAD family hydrolase [Marinactinospora thermotolerans]SKA17140.1 putative hydrolase of the HAD superfamily [Marinactinospora thermotolerans DSM 45154]
MGRRNLIFDADGTLWREGETFARGIDLFVRHLVRPGLSPGQVREILDEAQRLNSATHGYRAGVFERSLTDCLARLRPDSAPTEADRIALERTCAPVRDRALRLVADASPTLTALAADNRLFLLAQGAPAEQGAKIEASGLAPMFAGIGNVRQKDPATYLAFAQGHHLDPADTWVVGDTAQTDVWPALAAGMGAVLVAPATGGHDDLPEEDDRFRRVTGLAALVDLFG